MTSMNRLITDEDEIHNLRYHRLDINKPFVPHVVTHGQTGSGGCEFPFQTVTPLFLSHDETVISS